MRLLSGLSLITIRCAMLLLLPAAYTNPADHFMDPITVKNPITSEPSCPPVSHTDLLPDPAELRAYFKHVQVSGQQDQLHQAQPTGCCVGCAVLYAGVWGAQGILQTRAGEWTAGPAAIGCYVRDALCCMLGVGVWPGRG